MNVRSMAFHNLVQHLALSRRVRHAPASRSRSVKKARSLRWVSPAATYIICTNPRSGSWLLCKGLASTGLAGDPREWFNIMEEQRHRARWRMDHSTDLSFGAYFGLAKAESTTSNGVSGIKLHYYQLAELSKKIAAIESLGGLTDAQLMSSAFPNAKFLWLTRRDKARQAISLQIASSRQEWWAIAGVATKEREQENADSKFDPQAIARREAILTGHDAKWQSLFHDNRIEPLVVYYEDLVADYPGAIRGVLKWLGAPDADAVAVPPSRLKRQSDARNEEWLTRYLSFKSEGGYLAQSPTETDSPLFEPVLRIPDAWKQWVGRSKLLETKDEAIIKVLVNNGYGRETALAEVKRAKVDPYLLGALRTHRSLGNAASLLNALGQLARLDPQTAVVERLSNLSRNEFRDRYYATNRPVILQDLMTGWKAMTAWTPDHLKSVAGDRTVEVMTGRNADRNYERNGRKKHRAEMLFADYVDMVFSGKVTNDYYMMPNNRILQKPGAQPLLEDFTTFPEYLDPAGTAEQSSLWFGPAGTVTPLHCEKINTLLAQVAGRKRYRLVPTTQWWRVYNNGGVFSDVDCEKPDLRRYPRFRDATIIDIVLEPGEVLFMPVGWWHHVRALDVSMSISFTNFVFPNFFTWE